MGGESIRFESMAELRFVLDDREALAREHAQNLRHGRALVPTICGFAQLEDAPADNRTVIGGGNPLLAAGADAIRAGQYDEGIRLTNLGLERRETTESDRAAALSNLCAAYAAKRLPDRAIELSRWP